MNIFLNDYFVQIIWSICHNMISFFAEAIALHQENQIYFLILFIISIFKRDSIDDKKPPRPRNKDRG